MAATTGLYVPRPAAVRCDAKGRPARIAGTRVESVREEWLAEDRWWTPDPLARHYFELVLADGRCEVVFRDERDEGRWFFQRA